MTKFVCVCGTTIRTSGEVPNPIEWKTISSLDADDLPATATWEDVFWRSKYIFRCPASDHLWIFWDGIDEKPTVYEPTELPPGW